MFDIEEGVQGLENQLKAICKQSEFSIKEGCSLIIETGQCWSTHHLACLIGYGASAVCPWLTLEAGRHWLKHPKTQKLIDSKKINPLSIIVFKKILKKL